MINKYSFNSYIESGINRTNTKSVKCLFWTPKLYSGIPTGELEGKCDIELMN